METPSILLTTEGTYPCYTGGVSVWCDKLIEGLHEFGFHVLAITGAPNLEPVFPAPRNVLGLQLLPLWGTEEPGSEEHLFSDTYRRKLRTTPAIIRERFLPAFETAVRALLARGDESTELAHAFLALHRYFRVYDYSQSIRSADAWDVFVRLCSGATEFNLTLDEATCCMRWLQRYLAVLSADYPKVDIVHASVAGLAAIPGVILKMLYGTRFLLTEHGLYFREFYLSLGESNYSPGRRSFLRALNESIIKMNYLYADALTSLCEFNRKWQVRLGVDPQKIRIVPNGVSEEQFYGARQEPCSHPVVLTMARIMPLKGTDVLLRAALIVRQRLPNVKFRLLGEPAHKSYYEDCLHFIAEHGLQPIIELGHTNSPAEAYRAADLFCLPSISEALPYSVVEAMFSGCPVVATDVGGVRELLSGTGVLVKPNDPRSLAEGILDLLEGSAGLEKRRRLAALGLARAQKHYTLRTSIDRFRRLYKEFAGPARKPNAIAEVSQSESQRYSMVASG